MPSFDIVSEIDKHELTNAIDQSNREVENRFDFKNTNAKFELSESALLLKAQNKFQVNQMKDILLTKLSKRKIDTKCLQFEEITENLNEAQQSVKIMEGIDKEQSKKIVKIIKNSKIKVQSSIQGEQVRVTGKKRDDLQEIISHMKDSNFPIPLQYLNFRD